jgi:hypothetical protein
MKDNGRRIGGNPGHVKLWIDRQPKQKSIEDLSVLFGRNLFGGNDRTGRHRDPKSQDHEPDEGSNGMH